jgi:hypothetical protein
MALSQASRALVYSADIVAGAKDINANVDTIRSCRLAQEAVGATSIEAMVQQLEVSKQSYKFITICGHAAEGNQSIGGTYEPGEEGVIRSANTYLPESDLVADHVDDVKPLLQRLAAVMAQGGVLFLAGCEVAKGSQGRALLRRVSRIIRGVWVVGITMDVTEQKNEKGQCINIEKANEQGKRLGPITSVDIVMALDGKDTGDFPADMSVEEMLEQMTRWPYS